MRFGIASGILCSSRFSNETVFYRKYTRYYWHKRKLLMFRSAHCPSLLCTPSLNSARSSEVSDLGWPHPYPKSHLVLFTVFLADWFEYDGSFYVIIIDTAPPMTCACTDAKICHWFDLWRHQGDGAWLISIVRPKYSVQMHQKHFILCRIVRGTRWWRFHHVARLNSFSYIGL